MLAGSGQGYSDAMDEPGRADFDRGEYEQLVEQYADRLYNVALRITGQFEDAQDALQDAFLSAYRSWSNFRNQASRATWLYRITVNAALQRVRDRPPVGQLQEAAYDDLEVRDWSGSVETLAEQADLRDHLADGITRLPPGYVEVLVLRDVEGLSTAEAARVLDLQEATLKTRLHRARCLLRQHLADYLRS